MAEWSKAQVIGHGGAREPGLISRLGLVIFCFSFYFLFPHFVFHFIWVFIFFGFSFLFLQDFII